MSNHSFHPFPGLWINYTDRGLSFNVGRPGFFFNIGGGRGITFSRGNPAAGVPYSDMYGYRKDGGAPYNRRRTGSPTSVTGWLFILLLAGGAWWCYRHHTTPDAVLKSFLHRSSLTGGARRTISGANVHLRAQPSTHAAILTTLLHNQPVTVLAPAPGDWSHVRTSDGKEGYVANRFLD